MPDSLEVRVAHGGFEPRTPRGSSSTFDYMNDCVKINAFVKSSNGAIGDHLGLDYLQSWDHGLSKVVLTLI